MNGGKYLEEEKFELKKKCKRTLALFLTVAMVACLFCSFGSASAKSVRQFNEYLSFGDSTAGGYGLVEAEDDLYGYLRPQGLMIPGSFPALVMEETGADGYNYSRSGFRTEEMIRLLDPSYEYDILSDANLEWLGGTDPYKSFTEMQNTVHERIKNADLITLNIGSNDAMTMGIMYLNLMLNNEVNHITMSYEDYSVADLERAMASFLSTFGGDSIAEMLTSLINTAYSMAMMPAALAAYEFGCWQGRLQFGEKFDKIVGMIYDDNPDVTLVVVSLFNPYKDTKITDAGLIDLSPITNLNTQIMNDYITGQSAYRDRFLYADITDVECNAPDTLMGAEMDMSKFLKYCHPSANGHRYIADVVEDVLGAGDGSVRRTLQTYNVNTNVSPAGAGTVEYNTGSTSKEELGVAVTVRPSDGYSTATVSVTDAAGNPVKFYNIGKNYSFTMPSSDVTINVTFRQGAAEENCPSAKFSDLDTSMWYHEFTDYVLNKGIMSGTSDTTFEPYTELTRAMVCTMLYAMEGRPAVSSVQSVQRCQFR